MPAPPFAPPGSTMSLLVELTTNTIDEGYAEAAAQRAGDPTAPRRSRPLVLGAGLAAVALLLVVAAVQARRAAPAANRQRLALVSTVQARTRSTDALEKTLQRLRSQVSAARGDALSTSRVDVAALAQLTTLEQAVGETSASGSGIAVRLSDAPNGQAAGRILDRDVQDVVNALWSAGARAIAVGGERLGPTTAIRSAGQAILVDFRPITSPYVIVALGSPDTLAGRFAASAAVSRLRAASSAYGIGFSVQSVGHERLPPAADVAPRYAQPLEGAQ